MSQSKPDAVLGERLSFEPLDRFRSRAAVLGRLFGTRPAPQRVGRFMLEDRIGRGAMSTVYRARDPVLRRDVALKVLRDPASPSAATTERMRAEAQHLARLTHPNVVRVFGLGELDGRAVIVMEYVSGDSLDRWVANAEASAETILAAMLRVGHGLAAVHDAGLVHRDVKPANIVRTREGRVVLVDFGLAVESGERGGDNGVAGSPAYLPAAQLRGAPADAASDQFAYCVSLCELLTGRRPFPDPVDGDAVELRARRPAQLEGLPGRLARVIQRGLHPVGTERHPSMEALLRALASAGESNLRRWTPPVVVGVALAAGLGVLADHGTPPQSCSARLGGLGGAWGEERREVLRAALVEDGGAPRGVLEAFDHHAQAWIAAQSNVCDTAMGEHTASVLLDERMQCLRMRRLELKELVDVLVEGDDARSRAAQAVASLTDPETCVDRVGEPALTPAEATALARARAFEAAGMYAEALDVLAPLHRGAAEVPPEVLFQTGVLHDQAGRPEVAREWLERAVWAATVQGDDALTLRASTSLVHVVGFGLADVPDGERWKQHAEAALGRVGESPAYEAALATAAGYLSLTAGRFEDAQEQFERGLALHRAIGSGPLVLADLLTRLGNVAFERGRYEASLAWHEDAVARRREALGEGHPLVAESLANLANAHLEQGEFDRARVTMTEALGIFEDTLGADHVLVAVVSNNLGNLEADVDDVDAALAHYRRAVAVATAALGEEHPSVATMLDNEASMLRRLGRLDEARLQILSALAIRERQLGTSHPDVMYSLNNLGQLEAEAGDLERALELHTRAVELGRGAHDGDHPDVAIGLANVGAVYLAQGRHAEALDAYAEAVPMLERTVGEDHPSFARHLGGRGQASIGAGDDVAGMRDLRRAYALAQRNPATQSLATTLATTLAALGE